MGLFLPLAGETDRGMKTYLFAGLRQSPRTSTASLSRNQYRGMHPGQFREFVGAATPTISLGGKKRFEGDLAAAQWSAKYAIWEGYNFPACISTPALPDGSLGLSWKPVAGWKYGGGPPQNNRIFGGMGRGNRPANPPERKSRGSGDKGARGGGGTGGPLASGDPSWPKSRSEGGRL